MPHVNCNVNAKNNAGLTALILASNRGLMEIVKLLLENGANVNVVDNSGDTALIVANRHGYTEITDVIQYIHFIKINPVP